jgi:magnesium chelatase family protein
VLETLRQPIETGEVIVARANAHVRYPCRFLLLAAANPCRCGHLYDADQACGRAPVCGEEYLGAHLRAADGPLRPAARGAAGLLPRSRRAAGRRNLRSDRARVACARARQADRFAKLGAGARVNADAEGALLDEIATPDAAGKGHAAAAAERFRLTARGYHRVLRLARTIADLDQGVETVSTPHIAEALGYRLIGTPEL